MRNKFNLRLHELIGLRARITKSPSRQLIGLEGKVVDETKNLLVIETEKGEKRIPKSPNTFLFFLEKGEKVEIKGKEIAFRPEERTKKAL